MYTMPEMSQPSNQTPPSSGSPRAERGLAQLVVTSLLVVLAFSAGWFGNAYVNRATTFRRKTWTSWYSIRRGTTLVDNYVFTQNIDQQKMAYAAIDAIVGTLNDPGHTRFETAEEYQNETSSLNNQGTVGIGVKVTGGGTDPITITAVFPDTPAAKGGLQAGDQIQAVNGTDVRGMTLDQVTPLIRGKAGTQVILTILRPTPPSATPGATTPTPTPTPSATPSATPTATPTPGQTLTVALTRQQYTPKTALSFIIPQLNIADIQPWTSRGCRQRAADQIKAAEAQNVSGIILDLRGNGGGYLDQAVDVTSEFVSTGTNKSVLIVRSRTSSTTYPVTPTCVDKSQKTAGLPGDDDTVGDSRR